MRTIEMNVYSFNELSETAKQNALNNLCDINVDFEWWQFIYEDAKEIGLEITGFDLFRNKYANGQFLISACEVAQNILNSHGDMCNTYQIADRFLTEFNPIFTDYMETEDLSKGSELVDLESEFLNDLLYAYSCILQSEYDYLTSEKAIIETIEANEYEFTENGKLC